jgi:protein phosphatase
MSVCSFKAAFAGLTDVGLMREHNEDSILWDTDLGLALLADGMGGHNAGEVASALAVEHIRRALRERLLSNDKETMAEYASVVRDAVEFANSYIFDQSQTQIECAGMGTTLALMLLVDSRVIVAHVGDSRIYRLRNNELTQITSDHSLVQELVNGGYLTEEDARLSVSKNLITRALGIGEEVEVEIMDDEAIVDDLYLLCSDGLSDLVADAEIKKILLDNADEKEAAAKQLISLANEKGGSDNISVVLVSIHEAFSDDNGISD